MPGTLTVNPELSAEADFSNVERNWIDLEPPGLFPENQDSYWGQLRKLASDYLNRFDQLWNTYYLTMSVLTAPVEELKNYEIEFGLSVNTSATEPDRRAAIISRLLRGPFTRTQRQTIVASFIVGTITPGPPFILSPGGVAESAGGIPLFGEVNPSAPYYNIVENITNFSFSVRIRNDITIDEAGLRRALDRVVPAGISYTIDYVASP